MFISTTLFPKKDRHQRHLETSTQNQTNLSVFNPSQLEGEILPIPALKLNNAVSRQYYFKAYMQQFSY